MKVFKFLYVNVVLAILVLGLSTGCGKDEDNDDKTTDVAPIITDDTPNDVPNGNIDDNGTTDDITDDDIIDDFINTDDVLDSDIATDSNNNPSERNVWSDLPYDVRAYVGKQTCSGGEVISSDLVVDFRDVELAPNVTMANWSSLPYIYCNDENTYCNYGFRIERSALPARQERVHSNTLGLDAPVLFFDNLRSNDYGVTFIPKFKQRDPSDGNKVKEILFVGGNVDVNFPNTRTCGADVGDVRCDVENECVNAPESHICVFDYGKCSSGSSTYLHTISCNEGYVETTDDTIGVFFGAEAKSPRLTKRCVKEDTTDNSNNNF